MKSITEKFSGTPISEYIGTRVDEGFFSRARQVSNDIKGAFASLRDKLEWVKSKYRDAVIYCKNVVAKFKHYFLLVDDEGDILPAITPLTMDAAYVEGLIDKATTCVISSMASSKITGNKASWNDARRLYGSGDSRSYWDSLYNESKDEKVELSKFVNEVKLHTEDPQAKYNIIVDDKELRDTIFRHVTNPKLAKLLIYGAPGIGKTAVINAVADAVSKVNPAKYGDFKAVIKTLSNETADNFFLPDYAEIKIDGEVVDRKATDVPKTWLPVYKPTGDPRKDAILDDACGHGMLFIDELSRATPQVLNVILPLVNEGRLNEYVMGSGWNIVVASNRPEDETSGQYNIGNALSNRFAVVYYEPTVHTWRKWAETQGYMSPLLLQWLELPESETMSGGKYFYWDPNEDNSSVQETKILCTPRSWTNAMYDLAEFANTASLEGFKLLDIDTRILGRVLNKYIPAAAIDTFISFLDVIRGLGGSIDRTVADIWKTGKSASLSKAQLRNVGLPLAQLLITYHAKELPTQEEFTNICKWVANQGNDQICSYMIDNFVNVFIGSVDTLKTSSLGSMVHVIMNARWNIENNPKFAADKATIDFHTSQIKFFLDRWRLKGLTDIPDYSEGLQIIADKYGDIFSSYQINGKSGLDID